MIRYLCILLFIIGSIKGSTLYKRNDHVEQRQSNCDCAFGKDTLLSADSEYVLIKLKGYVFGDNKLYGKSVYIVNNNNGKSENHLNTGSIRHCSNGVYGPLQRLVYTRYYLHSFTAGEMPKKSIDDDKNEMMFVYGCKKDDIMTIFGIDIKPTSNYKTLLGESLLMIENDKLKPFKNNLITDSFTNTRESGNRNFYISRWNNIDIPHDDKTLYSSYTESLFAQHFSPITIEIFIKGDIGDIYPLLFVSTDIKNAEEWSEIKLTDDLYKIDEDNANVILYPYKCIQEKFATDSNIHTINFSKRKLFFLAVIFDGQPTEDEEKELKGYMKRFSDSLTRSTHFYNNDNLILPNSVTKFDFRIISVFVPILKKY